MKKFSILLLNALLAGVIMLSSCGKDEEEPVAPAISFNVAEGFATGDATVTPGGSVSYRVLLTKNDNNIQSLTITENNNPLNTNRFFVGGVAKSSATFDIGNSGGTFDIEIFAPSELEKTITNTIKFEVKDNKGLVSSKSVSVTFEVEATDTPLSAATNFTWERVGSSAGTGLAAYGLAWTSNTATSAIIKKDANKLVVLTSSDWTSITTKEALKDKVDNETGVEDFREISSTANATHDKVLATKKGDDYYLIRITNSTVASSGAGTTITITGQSKN